MTKLAENYPQGTANIADDRVLAPVVLGVDIKKELSELKNKIELDSKILYHKLFLEKTKLKIGDIVSCSFTTHSGDSKHSYMSSVICNGILKSYENGVLYVESIKDLTDSYNTSNGRTGRNYKSWWCYRQVKMKAEISSIQ
jgi:predicted nuclease with TOPRIM domain